jgi:hypothetical protein
MKRLIILFTLLSASSVARERNAWDIRNKTTLDVFLKFPIKSIVIHYSFSNCWKKGGHEVVYKHANNDVLQAKVYKHDRGDALFPDEAWHRERFKNEISATELKGILERIAADPGALPSMQDLSVTCYDNNLSTDDKKPDKSLIKNAGTVKPGILQKVLDQGELKGLGSSSRFAVIFINTSNDTLCLEGNYGPLFLPWTNETKWSSTKYYSAELSYFIINCLPADWKKYYEDDSARLLSKLAKYAGNSDQ